MIYKCYPHDRAHFATALRKDSHTGNLTWDNAPGQDVLIVQTAYGVDASTILEGLCNTLSDSELQLNDFAEVLPNVWVRYVSAAEKARNSGCKLHGEASTYTVFACQNEKAICKVFLPQNQAMISQSYHLPLEVQIDIHKVTKTSGYFFKRKQVDTGFYSISFRGDITGYQDGDLCYLSNGFEIPITKEAIDTRTIYVKSTIRPEIVSKNKGISIV